MHDHLPLLNVGFSMRRRFLARDNQQLGRELTLCVSVPLKVSRTKGLNLKGRGPRCKESHLMPFVTT